MSRKIKTLTKTQARDLHNAQMTVFAMRDKVFAAAAPRDDVPFMSCYALASMETRAAYDRARDELISMENQLIADGRGYHDAGGAFRAY